MGREVASAVSRWCALEDGGVGCEITAVCDLQLSAREWFRKIPTIRLITADSAELLKREDVDAVYVAVPHHLHEKLYSDVLKSGKDLLAEKPFGIDLAAARSIARQASDLKRFVRCSSEFPFLPGAQRVFALARDGQFGRPIEARSAFLHSSDLDPSKMINWKRQNTTCGNIGVMGDLGMHVMHLPLRLGWKPKMGRILK
jgi:predicted dehydrogenase